MFEGKLWFEFLDEPMRELIEEAYYLKEREDLSGDSLYDYSFLLFPMAKAYEGFLKKFLWSIELISKELRFDKTFRIGRSLNPQLPERFKNGSWVYDQLEIRCSRIHDELGKCGAKMAWDAWVMGRNQIFHYFSGKEGPLTLVEAEVRLEKMREVMEILVENEDRLRI